MAGNRRSPRPSSASDSRAGSSAVSSRFDPHLVAQGTVFGPVNGAGFACGIRVTKYCREFGHQGAVEIEQRTDFRVDKAGLLVVNRGERVTLPLAPAGARARPGALRRGRGYVIHRSFAVSIALCWLIAISV